MNAMMNRIYRGYQNILLVSDDAAAVEQFSEQANVQKDHICRAERACFLSRCLVYRNPADLLVIDVDALGFEDGVYLMFLARCILVRTPVVILATDLQAIDHQRFLSAGALEVMSRAGTGRVRALAAAA